LILTAIIQDYIFSAEPVGSRTLVKRHDIGLSPATIRNEMSDLEEMGFLEQPHTSAGRIPSHRGYRYYVNSLLDDLQLNNTEYDQLEALISAVKATQAGFSRHMAKLLSSLTSYISLIAEPSAIDQEIRHIDIIPLTALSASVIVVLGDGTVNHRIIDLPSGLDVKQIKALIPFINRRLQGIRLRDIDPGLLRELKHEFAGNMKLIDEVFSLVKHFLSVQGNQLVVDGATNLLTQPEFKDVNKVRELLCSLEQDDKLLQIMNGESLVGDLDIKIGAEIGLDSFSECSLVIATFFQRDRKVLLGVLGPTRMNYAKTIAFLKWLRDYYD